MTAQKTINILGIRGLPAAHGGFETFAASLAPHLRDRGWTVNVYCQIEPGADGNVRPDFEDDWHGIHRIHLGTRRSGSAGSVIFDWRCVLDATGRSGVNLVLGYNTAVFSLWLKARGRTVIMNMDGIEWKRAKWSLPVQIWFYINEFIGANIVDVPVADHPEIAKHLHRHGCRRSKVIPYCSDVIENSPTADIEKLGLLPNKYLVSIARIEPENSILEIVRAYSAKPRDYRLVVLGSFKEDNAYHSSVKLAASAGVVFPGAIYEKTVVESLRFHALAYLHGHQVGGTNPSLVEALGAGNPVIAHDNAFNRWVAGPQQTFFDSEKVLEGILDTSLDNVWRMEKGAAASKRHGEAFTAELVLGAYEALLDTVSSRHSRLSDA